MPKRPYKSLLNQTKRNKYRHISSAHNRALSPIDHQSSDTSDEDNASTSGSLTSNNWICLSENNLSNSSSSSIEQGNVPDIPVESAYRRHQRMI